jgi:hypothetical protein
MDIRRLNEAGRLFGQSGDATLTLVQACHVADGAERPIAGARRSEAHHEATTAIPEARQLQRAEARRAELDIQGHAHVRIGMRRGFRFRQFEHDLTRRIGRSRRANLLSRERTEKDNRND